jgi:hypothetical protein
MGVGLNSGCVCGIVDSSPVLSAASFQRPSKQETAMFDFAQNNQHGNGVQADMGRFWLLASTVLISVLPAAAADRTTKSTPIFG